MTEAAEQDSPGLGASQPPELSGWLYKQGTRRLSRWKKRYFVLQGTKLSYFKDDLEEEKKGAIDLHKVTAVVPIRTRNMASQRFLLTIKTAERDYKLLANDHAELDCWSGELDRWVRTLKTWRRLSNQTITSSGVQDSDSEEDGAVIFSDDDGNDVVKQEKDNLDKSNDEAAAKSRESGKPPLPSTQANNDPENEPSHDSKSNELPKYASPIPSPVTSAPTTPQHQAPQLDLSSSIGVLKPSPSSAFTVVKSGGAVEVGSGGEQVDFSSSYQPPRLSLHSCEKDDSTRDSRAVSADNASPRYVGSKGSFGSDLPERGLALSSLRSFGGRSDSMCETHVEYTPRTPITPITPNTPTSHDDSTMPGGRAKASSFDSAGGSEVSTPSDLIREFLFHSDESPARPNKLLATPITPRGSDAGLKMARVDEEVTPVRSMAPLNGVKDGVVAPTEVKGDGDGKGLDGGTADSEHVEDCTVNDDIVKDGTESSGNGELSGFTKAVWDMNAKDRAADELGNVPTGKPASGDEISGKVADASLAPVNVDVTSSSESNVIATQQKDMEGTPNAVDRESPIGAGVFGLPNEEEQVEEERRRQGSVELHSSTPSASHDRQGDAVVGMEPSRASPVKATAVPSHVSTTPSPPRESNTVAAGGMAARTGLDGLGDALDLEHESTLEQLQYVSLPVPPAPPPQLLLTDLRMQVDLLKTAALEDQAAAGGGAVSTTRVTPHARSLVLTLMAILLHSFKDSLEVAHHPHQQNVDSFSRKRTLYALMCLIPEPTVQRIVTFVMNINIPYHVPALDHDKLRSTLFFLVAMNQGRLLHVVECMLEGDPLLLSEWYNPTAVLCTTQDCREFVTMLSELRHLQFNVKMDAEEAVAKYLTARLLSLGRSAIPVGSIMADRDDCAQYVSRYDFLAHHEPILHLQVAVERIKQHFCGATKVFEEWVVLGNDSRNGVITKLVRGRLCSVLAELLFYNFKTKKYFGFGSSHIWDFIEACSSKFTASNLAALSLSKAVRRINMVKAPFPVNKSMKYRALVCYGLNSRLLHEWMEMIAQNSVVVPKYYEEWSFIRSDLAWRCIVSTLQTLSLFPFTLNVELEVIHQIRRQSLQAI